MASKWVRGFVFVSGLTSAGIAFAADVKGSSDHPLLNRFPGAEIRGYLQKDYDETVVPKAPIENRKEPGELLELEGKVTKISYRIPGEKSALEVMKNYEKALAQSGFETVFSCSSRQPCGKDMMGFIALSGQIRPTGFGDASFGGQPDRAVLAHRKNEQGDIHVFLHAVDDTANNRTYLYQHIVEGIAMDEDQVKVLPADALQQSLANQGHVAVPGVYFDTAKADIKPESDAALAEIAKLLTSDKKLKVYVVGHTDNAGSLDTNIALSQARAQAVVKALSASHGIDASRLAAKGVASLAPVASNAQEDGRSRNRRVEIVVQ